MSVSKPHSTPERNRVAREGAEWIDKMATVQSLASQREPFENMAAAVRSLANDYESLVEQLHAAEDRARDAQRERDEIGAALGEPCAECGHVDWRSDGYLDNLLHRREDDRTRLLEQLEAVEEKVARALYEKAMEERRTCLAGFRQDKRWDDDPYVGPVREGESRPTDWRDDWRDEARYFLSDCYPARELAPSAPRDNETGGSLVETPDPAKEHDA